MALLNIVKVRLYSHSSCTEEVLHFLQEKESFEVIATKDVGGTQGEYAKADLAFAIEFLSAYNKKPKGIRALFLGDKVELSEHDQKRMVASCNWQSVVKQVKELEVERNDLKRSLADISVETSLLEGWEGVEVSQGERFLSSFFRVHQKEVEKFEEQVTAITPLLSLEVVSVHGNEVYYLIIAQSEDMTEVRAIAQMIKGEEVSLPEGNVQERINALKKEKNAKEAKLSANKELICSLVDEIDGLKASYDYFASSEQVEKTMKIPQKAESFSVLEGWMIQRDIPSLQSDLEQKYSGVDIEILECEEGEKPPVVLKNSSGVRPFEVVTGMYGAPQSNEIDPTPFLAPFFVIFFGLCLTDAAYGMILTIAMGVILVAKMPMEEGMKEMIKLLFYAGISTIFFGVLFGGWFGIDPNADFIPSALTYVNSAGETMFLGQIVNPAKDLVSKIAPLVLLGGIFHLLLGVILHGYVSWKNKNNWDAFMVALPTFVTISVGILMGFTAKGFLPGDIFPLLKNILIGAFGVMTIGIMKSGGPIQWFMDVTGWLSNTLSYARLFALGLATGVVAQVFNTVAFTIGEMMPTGLDILIIIAIILFGHTLNIALNLLGAFVHSGRLQFVEFFGQFLEGGGRYFAPMKKSTRYVHNSL